MNRVTKRASVLILLVLLLVGGMGFFVVEYVLKSDQWVVSTGSPHVYNGSNIGCGVITDRDGFLLLDTSDGRVYCEDLAVRKATLHWLGDRDGYINAPAVSHYASEMAGFDYVNGVYSYGGTGGQAVLTLSAPVQAAALEAMGNRHGTVAVYNYKTGEILCAVSTPGYDPDNVPDIEGDTTGAYNGAYVNRFTQSVYIPGSIFKLVTTAAALDCVEGIEEMTFTCTGVYEYSIEDVTCERAHGVMTLETALASSCNCSFAQIVELIGKENMTKYVERFQVMQPISFDGITTAAGNYDVSNAIAVELAWSGIGQYTNQINPCRYMTFMGAIAGGGIAAQPYLVSQVTAGDSVTYEAKTATMGRIMPEEVALDLQTLMKNNVDTIYGAWNFPGLTVCAKSGTSELGGGQAPNAMFAGFVADEEYPLAFIVVVENGGYGSSTCVPILSKVLAACKTVIDGQ